MTPLLDNTGLFTQTKITMPDDTGFLDEIIELELKRRNSYKGLIPSMDFDTVFYQQFIENATPYELENDVITRETIVKIAYKNTDEVLYEPSQPIVGVVGKAYTWEEVLKNTQKNNSPVK